MKLRPRSSASDPSDVQLMKPGDMVTLAGGRLQRSAADFSRALGWLVSLDLKEATVETAIQSIKQQTNYLFVSMNVDTRQRVTAKVERKSVNEALAAILLYNTVEKL